MDWIEGGEAEGTPLLPAVHRTIREIESGAGMHALSFDEILRAQESLIADAQTQVVEAHGAVLREEAAVVERSVDTLLQRAFRTHNKQAVRELSEDLIALRQGIDYVDA